MIKLVDGDGYGLAHDAGCGFASADGYGYGYGYDPTNLVIFYGYARGNGLGYGFGVPAPHKLVKGNGYCVCKEYPTNLVLTQPTVTSKWGRLRNKIRFWWYYG